MGKRIIPMNERADFYCRELRKHSQIITAEFYYVGGLLRTIKEDHLWRGLAPSFGAFLADYNIGWTQAHKLIEINRHYEGIGIPADRLVPIGVEKAHMLIAKVTKPEDLCEWIPVAESLPVRDLGAHLDPKRDRDTVEIEIIHYFKMTPDQRQQFWIRVNEENTRRHQEEAKPRAA